MDQSLVEPILDASRKGRQSLFTDSQRVILLKYFDDYGMTSTHRRNVDLMARCSTEVGTSIDKVKNWIGSEAVKRKRKAGILPLPKFEFSRGTPELKVATPPASKKIRRVNGYNLFFSEFVQSHPEIGTDFKERNAMVAQKWAEQSEEERKQWGARAEAVCSSSVQEFNQQQQQQQTHITTISPVHDPVLLSSGSPMTVAAEENLIERTLLSIQEKFDLLEQLGFEGYGVLVSTSALQTHLLATSKGRSFHKTRQQAGKALENPLIGYVFSEASSPIAIAVAAAASQRIISNKKSDNTLMSSSLETMQKSVMNAFAVKYKVATGRSELSFTNPEQLGVQVYGMPPGVPFHSPLLYNQQQLQQILANLEKIVFLKEDNPLAEVEIPADTVTSLVDPNHDIQLATDETANH